MQITTFKIVLNVILIIQVGQNPPEVGKDPHWDIGVPEELPYTVAALPFRIPNLESGAENIKLPVEQHRVVTASDISSIMGYTRGISASSAVS